MPLARNSLSSEIIEYTEKIKLLRALMFIHYVDNKYDVYIRNILDSISLLSEDKFLSIEYSENYLVVYVLALKYLLGDLSFLELLKEYILIANKEYIFSEMYYIIDYLDTKIKFNDYESMMISILINQMLVSDKEENRVSAIKLSRVIYNTKYFNDIYEQLLNISKDAKYEEMRAVVFLIKKLQSDNRDILRIKENIDNNRNYNIRYISKRFLNQKG